MNMDFYGNKLLLCKTKEEFDNLTLEQMEGYDTAFYCKPQRRGGGIFTNNQYQVEMVLILNIVNKNLIRDDLQLDPYFCFLKKMYGECITNIYHKDITVNELFFIVDGGVIRCEAKMPKVVTSLPHATLYDVENQHWVCEKGNTHNIPKDKSVNIHEYYDVVVNENSVECTVDFFERGVGETKSCGSGALCVGKHLFEKHNKTVIIKTTSGGKYFVDKEGISVEM